MKYYGIGEQVELLSETIEEAIDQWILSEPDLPEDDILKIRLYKPMEIDLNADSILTSIYDSLDDEYGKPYDMETTTPAKSVIKAAEQLVEAIKNTYYPYQCEPTGEIIEYPVDDQLKKDVEFFKRGKEK